MSSPVLQTRPSASPATGPRSSEAPAPPPTGRGLAHASDAVLRDFIENGTEGMHQVDDQGTILWANQAEMDLLGYPAEEYIGQDVRRFHADPAVIASIFDRLLAGQPVRNQRARLRCRDGSLKWVLINSSPRGSGGAFRSRCFTRDIGEAVALEQALESRVRQQAAVARLGRLALTGGPLEALFDAAMHEIAATLDVQHVGLCQFHGADRFSFTAGVGWPAGYVGTRDLRISPGSQGDYMMRSGKPVVYEDAATETRFRMSDVVQQTSLVSGVTVLVPERGQPWGILGAHSSVRRSFTADDVAFLDSVANVLAGAIERRRTDEQLERNRTELEQLVAQRTKQLTASNRELEAFSYTVSHDLRTPLRAISGYASLLEARHGAMLAPGGKELIDGIRGAAARLGHLIDDLLELSRVQRVEIRREAVDLSALAREVLAGLAASHPARRVHVRVQDGLRADGDPRLLAIALENLLANAWKFTRSVPEPRIEVGQDADGAFFVRDNGAGFDMAYASRLFQPFERLHRPSEFEGTGIGLATVQRILGRHGGTIWAKSEVGKGADFRFTLGP